MPAFLTGAAFNLLLSWTRGADALRSLLESIGQPVLSKEKRSDWRFDPTAGGWVWHVIHPDGASANSEYGFPTLTACIADATLHGYVAWIPEAERRDRSPSVTGYRV
ncbi:MAG TPA: hypothetical protein VGC70_12385 [Burkholderiales bacterium]